MGQPFPQNVPLVSVIMPVYNGERFVEQAVANIIGQQVENMEIILIDDGSTDDTAAIIRRLQGPIRFVTQPNQGPGAARNHGLRLAQADIIAFLDVDDLWPACTLRRQIAFLKHYPDAEIIMGRVQGMRKSADKTETDSANLNNYVPWQEPIHHVNLGASIFRRTLFDRIGWFDEQLLINEDSDLFLRAREAGVPIKRHNTITLFYRRHETNTTKNELNLKRFTFDLIRKTRQRRRQAEYPKLLTWTDVPIVELPPDWSKQTWT